jgi:hypothetical protein
VPLAEDLPTLPDCGDAGSDCTGKYEDIPMLELPSLPGLDEENRHPSTVMLKPKGLAHESECSGVVVGTDRVLTAAHCVCEGRKVGSVTGGMILMDGKACAKSVLVVTLIQHWPHEPSTSHTMHYDGTVRPHPRFKMILERDRVVTSHADLAVIVLEKNHEALPLPIPLAATEVEVDEAVTVVGYDQRWAFGALPARHSGRHLVGKPPVSGDEGALLEPPGVPTFRGDNGGPVLREGSHGLMLVGIVSRVADQETVFTGTHSHQPWLRAEIQRAATGTATPTSTPRP